MGRTAGDGLLGAQLGQLLHAAVDAMLADGMLQQELRQDMAARLAATGGFAST